MKKTSSATASRFTYCKVCGNRLNLNLARAGENNCGKCGATIYVVKPQDGPQYTFCESKAQIIGFGGHAGGGKTFAIPLKFVKPIGMQMDGFKGCIFRRTMPEITVADGPWDVAQSVFSAVAGGQSRSAPNLEWVWPKNNIRIQFRHLQHEQTKYSYQGAQWALIGFDETTHFTESQVWYIVSRNRSTCGYPPQIIMTFNPDATSWVKRMYAPWVDKKHPLYPTASGTILYLVRHKGEYHYYKTKQEAMEAAMVYFRASRKRLPFIVKSVTFIESKITDNKILLDKNPEYLGNLYNLDEIEQARLLGGDWDILGDRFFSSWLPNKLGGAPWHVIPAGKFPHSLKFSLGIDYGYSAPWCCLLIGVDYDGRVYVLRELYATEVSSLWQAQLMYELMVENGIPTNIPKYAGFDIFAGQRHSEGATDPIVSFYRADRWLCPRCRKLYRDVTVSGFDDARCPNCRTPLERQPGLNNFIEAGRDPVQGSRKIKEYLNDWGPAEGWVEGKPGLQVMDCCKNLIRCMGEIQPSKTNCEVYDTNAEDHPIDSLRHMLTKWIIVPKKEAEEYIPHPRARRHKAHRQRTSE